MTRHVTIEITDEQAAHFAERSGAEGQPLEALLADAVQGQLAYDLWVDAETLKGLEELDRGEAISQEQVVERLEALKAELLSKQAAE